MQSYTLRVRAPLARGIAYPSTALVGAPSTRAVTFQRKSTSARVRHLVVTATNAERGRLMGAERG